MSVAVGSLEPMFDSRDASKSSAGPDASSGPPDDPPFGPPTAEERELVWELDQMAGSRLAQQDLPDAFVDDTDAFPAWDAGPWAALRSPRAESLSAEQTGSHLAFLLEGAEAETVDDYTVVEIFASWWRLVGWAHAGAARAAAELARREEAVVGSRAPVPEDEHAREVKSLSAASTELAMRVMVSRPAAQAMIDLGKAATGPLWPVVEALEDGSIDLPRARAFVEGLGHLPGEVAMEVQDQVLPSAPRRTVRHVRQDIARALVSTDPEEATSRHARARGRRRVCRPTPLADGMAGIWAVLPAADAVALDVALDAAARTARNGGDPRTTDQLRADALASVGHDALRTGWIGTPPTEPTAEGAPRAFRVGSIGGIPARIRVTVPLGVLLPEGNGGSAPRERGGTDRRDGAAGGPAPAPGSGRLPEVAELDGYGPVTPEVARALALGGTWTRLITDPDTGSLQSISTRRYRPPAELAEIVRARDKTCTRPGCGAPAQGCDLDHIVPYHLGGETSAWNLGPLCPTDHALKSAGVLRIERVGAGTYDVFTPAGHVYRRHPSGTSTLLRRPDPEPDVPPY